MPTDDIDAPSTAYSADVNQNGVACPIVNPPSEYDGAYLQMQRAAQRRPSEDRDRMSGLVGDNTAIGMSMLQEDSMYISDEILPEKMETEAVNGKDRMDVTSEEDNTDNADVKACVESGLEQGATVCEEHTVPVTPGGMTDESDLHGSMTTVHFRDDISTIGATVTFERQSRDSPSAATTSSEQRTSPQKGFYGSITKPGLSSADEAFDLLSETPRWDFSQKRLSPEYPSSLFRPFSTYQGTQQSDRQIYNVTVTVLSVNIEQATMSGYLQICGLTPDHPTLTTFFTGEIIGGPDQKYSFRTKDPAWGASDKTDVTHWARFPAWRSLSSHAKQNINFVYPLNQEKWWQQEHIFMRWKEHFLVPDYKLKSIQGASFEGFYYICLNQVEGRISGIYFHSKSEKYQQLELKHEGKQGVWARGPFPSVEFR